MSRRKSETAYVVETIQGEQYLSHNHSSEFTHVLQRATFFLDQEAAHHLVKTKHVGCFVRRVTITKEKD